MSRRSRRQEPDASKSWSVKMLKVGANEEGRKGLDGGLTKGSASSFPLLLAVPRAQFLFPF